MSPDIAKVLSWVGVEVGIILSWEPAALDSNKNEVMKRKFLGSRVIKHPSFMSLSNFIYYVYTLSIHIELNQPMIVQLLMDKSEVVSVYS